MELLLELFSEEIPARMQKKAAQSYYEIFIKAFGENGISFSDLKVFCGSRRLTLNASGLPKYIQTMEEEIKGPKIGVADAAIQGFCRSHNIKLEQLTQKPFKDQLCYVYNKPAQQIALQPMLEKILPKAIGEYVWPKSMYWSNYNISWVRPLKNIMCILDGEILPIGYGHLTANNLTFGHRFRAPDSFFVKNFKEYEKALRERFVILSDLERMEMIKKALDEKAAELKLFLKKDERLLEEVAGLVEYPEVMIGKIPEKFINLPAEILVSSMRTHQKYFALFDKNDKFAPYFIFVSNMPRSELIIHGNEKVLSARLSDALYFYNQDIKQTLESRLPRLEKMVFHARLGTMRAKTERLAKICKFLTPSFKKYEQMGKNLQIAARLCASDLTSEVVGEFPELEGIMGYYYAKNEGVSEEIATAIKERHKPRGIDDMPQGMSASILALADKIDSLVGLMLAGEQATGSKDPYALRRLALGIIRIILNNPLLLVDIKTLVDSVAELYSTILPISQDIKNQILLFIEERAKFNFKNYYDISLVNAVLDLKMEGNLHISELTLIAFQDFLSTHEGANLLSIYKRANNILRGQKVAGQINPELFTSQHAKTLYNSLKETLKQLDLKIAEKDFPDSLRLLATLQVPLGHFFDNVMVIDKDPLIANNNLLLLQKVVDLFLRIAKFDQL